MELGIRPGGDRALSGRIALVTALRLIFLTLLLGATAFFYLRGDLAVYPESLRITFATIAAAYACGAAYAAALRSGVREEVIAYGQIVLDQITWTAIVYVTGGATSGATSFYALSCLVGAALIGLRGAALGAVCGVGLYGLLCAALSLRWISPPRDQAAAFALPLHDLVYPLLVNTLGIGVVALLGGYLAERLRITGGELAEAKRRMQDAERLALVGRVAAGLAHEIRNPLGSISGSIDMLRESPGLSEEDKLLCGIIQREAARLNHLVGDMLDLSKPRPPRVDAVDVAGLAREVVALAGVRERSGAGDVHVSYEGPEQRVVARCDGAQIRQVLWNLVRNAVQASGAGSEVRVRVASRPPDVVMEVEDDGPGIAESARDQIFDAFFTTRSHGTGMGLAVVKRIIDEHAPYGARIDVASPRDARGGATFRVVLRAAGG